MHKPRLAISYRTRPASVLGGLLDKNGSPPRSLEPTLFFRHLHAKKWFSTLLSCYFRDSGLLFMRLLGRIEGGLRTKRLDPERAVMLRSQLPHRVREFEMNPGTPEMRSTPVPYAGPPLSADGSAARQVTSLSRAAFAHTWT